MNSERPNIEVSGLTRIVDVLLRGDIAILFCVVSLIIGIAALIVTPREEEPQIVVPMADVLVEAPGLSAAEVERKITDPLEKLLYQIDGVEYVYSMTQFGRCQVTVRFYVGEDREDSLLKLHNMLQSHTELVPPEVASWIVKPIEIDDVPIVIASLWSKAPDRYSDPELRRLATELQLRLQRIPNTNQVHVIGGRPRRIRVEIDPQRLAARQLSIEELRDSLSLSNIHQLAGDFEQMNDEFIVEAGDFLPDAASLKNLVVAVNDNRPVYLQDVAFINDGPAEVESLSWMGQGGRSEDGNPMALMPAVHISVAKRKGANAVAVAHAVDAEIREFAKQWFPDEVNWRITRDYGETANDKVNELVEGLIVAVLTVVGLIGLVIGWRPALVVALAIPVCYGLTLGINLMLGYTINRVTLFALILSLGLLVDDPITDVENIARYFAMKILPPRESVLRAIKEVRPALLLSTLAIIASFLPLSFITGMMGPYMGPMAINVPLTVTLSTVVAFAVTPWMAMVALRKMNLEAHDSEGFDITKRPLYRLCNRLLRPILQTRTRSVAVIGGVFALLLLSSLLPLLRLVPLKMLPYDNKNEFQITIDMPEGTPLAQTDAVARTIARQLPSLPEVRDFQLYVGTASPMDFNGMVRHYFWRQSPHQADIRVNLVDKENRRRQSHEIVMELRRYLESLDLPDGVNLKLVEVPPGPPVLATLTAEVYGPDSAPYSKLIEVTRQVEKRMAQEPGVVDVDSTIETEREKWVFVTDKPKAALSGISTLEIANTLSAAIQGIRAAELHLPQEIEPVWIEIRLPLEQRSSIEDFLSLYVKGKPDQMVQLSSLGHFERQPVEPTIHHKNLKRVAYVFGEVAGRPPADAIMDMHLDMGQPARDDTATRPLAGRTWLQPGSNIGWDVPQDFEVLWNGEGEWKITLDVFRDLGIAFGVALLGIYVMLMFQTGSRFLPLLIMVAIPLTLIGILPGFWVLNTLTQSTSYGDPDPVFFTATAMIGMIALAGIVVRNSVVLVDFIQISLSEGLDLQESIIRSVAVRTRPILLTAGTTLLGNWVITLDPVFSGLAWAVIFGILTSTLFTIVVVPVAYGLLFRHPTEPSSRVMAANAQK
jgi:multidrug efflux pump subunit AcrB